MDEVYIIIIIIIIEHTPLCSLIERGNKQWKQMK